MNEALPRPSESPQHENQGENLFKPDSYLGEDSMLEKIREMKRKATEHGESQYEQIVKAIKSKVSTKEKDNPAEGTSQSKMVEEFGADGAAKNQLNERRKLREKKRKAEFQIGDKVRIKTARFGKRYAIGRPEYTEGNVVRYKGGKEIYKGGEEIYDTYISHLEKLGTEDDKEDGNVVATVCYKGKWYKRSQRSTQ
jgi:hypothetical protein